MQAVVGVLVAYLGLVSCAPTQQLEKRAPPSLIGFRQCDGYAPLTAKQQTALAYMNAGSVLTPQPAGLAGLNQIGPGIYTSLAPALWGGDWNCAVEAPDSAVFQGYNKAWIPQSYGTCGKPLWNTYDNNNNLVPGAANIAEYLLTLNPSFTPENTILYAWIWGYDPVTNPGDLRFQQLIPNSLASAFKVSCYETGSDATSLQLFKNLPAVNIHNIPGILGLVPPASEGGRKV